MGKGRSPATLERDVLVACLDALAVCGIPADRQNTGAMLNAKGKLVRFGQRGNADITATIPRGPHAGKRLEIEVKRPGERPRPEQYERGRRVLDAGGFWIWTDDPIRLANALRRLLEGWRVEIDEDGNPWVTNEQE